MDDVIVVTQAATLLADPLRLRLLQELEDGVLTVSELSTRLQISQPRVSAQLATLRKAGWVDSEVQGRQHYYRLASPQIMVAIQELAAVPVPRPNEAIVITDDLGAVTPALRTARRCYDHLAGILGVQLCEYFLQEGWLVPTAEGHGRYQPTYCLTDAGGRALAARNVPAITPQSTRRRFAYACPDWTETEPHLGGALAAHLYHHLQDIGIVQPQTGSRVVLVDDTFSQWLWG